MNPIHVQSPSGAVPFLKGQYNGEGGPWLGEKSLSVKYFYAATWRGELLVNYGSCSPKKIKVPCVDKTLQHSRTLSRAVLPNPVVPTCSWNMSSGIPGQHSSW